MNYAKCSICHEKDFTENMLIPCKCDRWVHRKCLDKRRVSSAEHYEKCPECGSTYQTEKKVIPEWIKYTQIIGSVILDLCIFISMFTFASIVTGKVLKKFGYQVAGYSEAVTGCLVICGVVGFVVVVCAMVSSWKNGCVGGGFMPMHSDSSDNVITILVIIGIIALITATAYWMYHAISERIAKHKRSVGVKENVVIDYTRGIDVV